MMAVEDKDFILRQVKQLARGLVMMLSKRNHEKQRNFLTKQNNLAILST